MTDLDQAANVCLAMPVPGDDSLCVLQLSDSLEAVDEIPFFVADAVAAAYNAGVEPGTLAVLWTVGSDLEHVGDVRFMPVSAVCSADAPVLGVGVPSGFLEPLDFQALYLHALPFEQFVAEQTGAATPTNWVAKWRDVEIDRLVNL